MIFNFQNYEILKQFSNKKILINSSLIPQLFTSPHRWQYKRVSTLSLRNSLSATKQQQVMDRVSVM